MNDPAARETINRVEVLQSGELLLGLASGGRGLYQHIYRAAAGVHWDEGRRGFTSTPIREWSVAHWYAHIGTIVREELGVELVLGDDVAWRSVSEQDRDEIQRSTESSPLR